MATQTTNGTISPTIDIASAKTPGAFRSISEFELPGESLGRVQLLVAGISPLIMHQWSKKQRDQLEAAQTGRARSAKGARVPAEEASAAAYVLPGCENLPDAWDPDWEHGTVKYYFPAAAFRHAFIYGCGQVGDVKKYPKTKAAGWVFINNDKPVIDFDEAEVRTDITRNPTQPKYRPMFTNWRTVLDVSYDTKALSLEELVYLFDLGLSKGGVGEWRPSSPKNKSGSYGRANVTHVNPMTG